jgi:uncharacterized FAD-dependent dehydrogenase
MGPCGLSAAARLEGTGLRFAIIDSGKPSDERDRYSASDATSGHGGAGLFSDGKFSFFPSATELWTLPRQDDLKSAYAWTCGTLGGQGLDTPPFPSHPAQYSGRANVEGSDADWVLKAYPSDHLSLAARLRLIDEMVSCIQGSIINECHVEDIKYNQSSDTFTLETLDLSPANLGASTIHTRRILVATGRFGPLAKGLANLTTHHNFRRLEVGFRIEQASDRAFFRNMKQLDPKFRFREADNSVEWRTFCACRKGETVLTETNGLWTVSGRSDCPPTGRSNSGFNTLILDGAVASRTINPVIQAMTRSESYFELPMKRLLEGDPETVSEFDIVYGSELRRAMTAGLSRLGKRFPDLGSDRNAKLIGPTLEGVGWYPTVDGNLRLLDVPAYVAGDACGQFRGIVAAMISGHYSASSVVEELLSH